MKLIKKLSKMRFIIGCLLIQIIRKHKKLSIIINGNPIPDPVVRLPKQQILIQPQLLRASSNGQAVLAVKLKIN